MNGLRERKKERTREMLVTQALRLFSEKGFSQTTIEEISAAADVAPRTFFRYFASKEDVVFLGQEEENALIAQMVGDLRPGEDVVDALIRGTCELLSRGGQTLTHAPESLVLIQRTPELRARKQQLLEEVQDLVAAALMPRRATKAEALRIRMLAAAFIAALNTAMNAWLSSGARGSLVDQVKMVGALIKHGFSPR
jgi:AcrR family transcriptional regulator